MIMVMVNANFFGKISVLEEGKIVGLKPLKIKYRNILHNSSQEAKQPTSNFLGE